MNADELDKIFSGRSGAVSKDDMLDNIFSGRYEQESIPPASKSLPDRIGADQAFATGAAQGVSFGYGDEALAALSAAGAKALDFMQVDRALGGEVEESFGDIYRASLDKDKSIVEKSIDDNPAAFVTGNILGAIGTGGAGAATKTGQALARGLRSGSLPTRIAKGAAVGATSGAAYGAGSSSPGERTRGAAEGAAVGAVFGGAVPAVGSAANRVAASRQISKAPELTSEAVKAMASDLYSNAEKIGGVLRPQVTNNFLNKLNKMVPQTPAGKALAGDSPFTKIVTRITTLKNKPLSLREAQEIDEFLSDAVDAAMDAGRVTKQSKKLMDVQTAFREVIEGASDSDVVGGKAGFESLKEARTLWAAQHKLADIERIVARASQMDQPVTGIRNGFRTLVNNPSRMRGYTKEEQMLLRKAAKTGIVTDLMRVAGSRLNPIIASSAGLATMNPAALGAAGVAWAGGAAARRAAESLQRGRANAAANEVLKRVGRTQPPPQTPGNPALQTGAIGSAAESTVTPQPPVNAPAPENAPLPPQSSLPQQLREDEGLRFSSYMDTTGNKTVGFGFNMDSGIAKRVWDKAGVGASFKDVYNGKASITPQEAEALGAASYQIAVSDARSFFPDIGKLSPARQDALLNLSYQMGLTTLNQFKGFKKALERKDYKTAAKELMNSRYFEQTPNRARRVINQIYRG